MENPNKHNRIHERLEEYWNSIRGDRRMPEESDVSPESISDIWPNCFLVDVRNSGYEYDYLGERILDAYGDDLRGRAICESIVYPHPPKLMETFREVSSKISPVHVEEVFTNAQGVEIKYRSCVLPLTQKGGLEVAFLLGGMKWKAS